MQVLYDSRDRKSVIIFFSKLVIWDSLRKFCFKVILHLDKKQKNYLSFLGVGVCHHRTLVTIKQNQNKTYSSKSLPDGITLQTTSGTCVGRFYGYCRNTVDNHKMLVFEGLLDEWDKIWNNVIGKYNSWLYHQSSFRFFTDWFIECWHNSPYSSEAGLFYKQHPWLVEVDSMIIFAVALWITIQGSSSRVCFQMEWDMRVRGYLKTHDFAIEVWCSPAQTLIYYRRSYIAACNIR